MEGCRLSAIRGDVVVVGAGIAGLTAAMFLQGRGTSVTVVEGSKRIGGRIESCTPPAGEAIELGGKYIASYHHQMLSLCHAYGVSLAPVKRGDVELPHLVQLNGKAIVGEARSRICQELNRAFDLCREIAKCSHNGEGLGEKSVEVWLGEQGFSDQLVDVFSDFPARSQSAEGLIKLVRDALPYDFFSDTERFYAPQGLKRLPEGMGAALQWPVQFGLVLTAFSETANCVKLTFTEGAFHHFVEAKKAIIAVPPGCAPNLPPYGRLARNRHLTVKATLLAGMKLIHTEALSDGIIRLAEVTRRRGVAITVDVLVNREEYTSVPSEIIAENALQLLGLSGASIDDIFEFPWGAAKFYRGAYAVDQPRTTSVRPDNAGYNNIFFAGDWLSRKFKGYMEGAATSGKDAAEQCLVSLGLNS